MPFHALRSYNFRLYFSGQSLSLVGTWMQRTAVYWLVFEKTGSPFMLGLTVFAAQFPSFLFSIIGGVVSDRYNRFHVLMTSQVASFVQATALAMIVSFSHYEVWHILVLTAILGVINAFDVPARQAMIYDMVDNKDHLPNAIALNSSMVHAARLIGPAISGIVLETFGAGVSFGLNALSFVAVIASLAFMKLKPYKKPERVTNAFRDMVNGFTYLRQTPEISNVMLMLALVSLVSLPYVTLLPIFTSDVLRGDASTFGYLNSFIGLGALGGALFLAGLKPGSNLKLILLINTVLFGAGLIGFSQSEVTWVAMPLAALVGFGMMSQTTISNTLIQTAVTPTMRGRVLSYFAMAFFGMQPLGGLLVGTLSGHIGTPATLLIQGLITLLIALIFLPFLRKRVLKPTDRMKMDQLEERTIETT